MRITVAGVGYLGATHAACMARLGHDVVGLDVDEERLASLGAGRLPFHEPGLTDVLREGIASGRLRFTSSAAEAGAHGEVVFVCVGTPQRDDGDAADLSALHAVVDGLVPHLRTGSLLVGKSTVPVGPRRSWSSGYAGCARRGTRRIRTSRWRGTPSSCARGTRSRAPSRRTGWCGADDVCAACLAPSRGRRGRAPTVLIGVARARSSARDERTSAPGNCVETTCNRAEAAVKPAPCTLDDVVANRATSDNERREIMTTPHPPAIVATGLRKSFGDKVVLDGIDLHVPAGTIFALLGPNGAGKTTAVQILSTLISADGGDVEVGGHDLTREPDSVRAAIGVTGQFSAVDDLLTGEENLILMADLHHLGRDEGRRRSAELLQQFDLVEAGSKRVATYSGGMRRRLDLAMGLVGNPRIVFLDEPTTGLDPRSRRTMWQIIRELVAGGVTIFLTTQYLQEADELADRIAVLDHGMLVAEGTAAELKRLVPGGHVSLRFADARGLESAAHALVDVTRDHEALTLQVPSDGSLRALKTLFDRLDDESIEVDGLTVHTPDLDDVFFALTGQPDTEKESVR